MDSWHNWLKHSTSPSLTITPTIPLTITLTIIMTILRTSSWGVYWVVFLVPTNIQSENVERTTNLVLMVMSRSRQSNLWGFSLLCQFICKDIHIFMIEFYNTRVHYEYKICLVVHIKCSEHCEILGSYLQQHHQHHVFRAQFWADPHSQTEANKEEILSCWISRYKLTASGVTDITSLPCSA